MTMLIGINAVAAFKQPRTGVEEYAYQLIKHLAMLNESEKHRFLLYCDCYSDIELPDNFQLKHLKWPLPAWTQIRLASEMAFNKPDVLFIPAHVLPMIHPKNSVVTIHGLEYEYYPQMYPKKHLAYLRWSTKYALKHARKIIAVSENTKKDLVELYGGKADKITVVHHGISLVPERSGAESKGLGYLKFYPSTSSGNKILTEPYILYLGRIETKKNVQGLIAAFQLLKQKYKVPHKLVLAGARGYLCHSEGASEAKRPKNLTGGGPTRSVETDDPCSPDEVGIMLVNCADRPDASRRNSREILSPRFARGQNDSSVIFTNYVPEQQKWDLLRNAALFAFPSFYEGFGMPVLEAQQVGCPVLSSNVSSIPEVVGDSAVLIDPNSIEQICEAMYKIISDKKLRDDIIKKGHDNVKKFSWRKCAEETLKILIE